MFSSICAWTNEWVNNRDADDVRRHRPNYDVTIMKSWINECHKYIRSVGKFSLSFEHYETVQWKINRNTHDKNIKINLNLRHKMMQINVIAILCIICYISFFIVVGFKESCSVIWNSGVFYDFAFVYTPWYIYIYIWVLVNIDSGHGLLFDGILIEVKHFSLKKCIWVSFSNRQSFC